MTGAIMSEWVAGSSRNDRRHHTGICSLVNLALKKATDQSSYSSASNGTNTQEDSSGAVNGVLTGSFSFHTDREVNPWWSVDLGKKCNINEVRIYNRNDAPGLMGRFSSFRLEIRTTEKGKPRKIVTKTTDEVNLLNPIVINFGSKITGQFLKIILTDDNFFHLDEVEVYGKALPQKKKITPDGEKALSSAPRKKKAPVKIPTGES